MGRFVDLTGKRYGRLIVVGRAENGPRGKVNWKCLRDCGKYTVVRGDHLKSGETTSCGCFNVDTLTARLRTHGDTGSGLYAVYRTMIARCENANNGQFLNYGGRGISVCPEWRRSYEAFREWAIKAGYKPGLSIDRIDFDGDYHPDNCRWATPKMQGNNKRNNHRVTCKGVTKTIAEWADETGIPQSTIFQRIWKLGWSDEDAVTTPVWHKRGC